MRIRIKVLSCNTIDILCSKVMVYDSNNNLVIDEFLESRYLECDLCLGEVYKIIVVPPSNFIPKIRFKCYYVTNYCKEISFLFEKVYQHHFKLTDCNYNLPIEKGEMILWLDHIT